MRLAFVPFVVCPAPSDQPVGLLLMVLRGAFRARAYIYRGVTGENKPLHL
nr:MAG TPA: hypothetical protein [Caudoviricetes sp.]